VILPLGLDSARIHGQTFNNPRPALAGNFLAGLHWKRQNLSGVSGNLGAIPGACLRITSGLPTIWVLMAKSAVIGINFEVV